MRQRIQNKLGAMRADKHLWEVLQDASSSLIIQILGTVSGFAVSVVIARMLGVEGSGVYYLALSVATIAATIGRVGLDNTVVRFISSSSSVQEWGTVRFVYRTAMRVVAVATLFISLVMFFGAEWISSILFDKPYMELPLKLVSWSILPLSFAMILAESIRGLKNIAASQWIKTSLISLCTMLLLYPFVHLWSTNGAVAAYVVAVSITALTAWLLWRSAWRKCTRGAAVAENDISLKSIFQSSWPLYGVALTGLVMQQAATVFLGIWSTAAEIGVFNVANRLASLLLFPLLAMISILAPKFAALHRQGDLKGLKTLSQNSTRILAMLAVPSAILVAVCSEWILSIFGTDFVGGADVLVLLLVGVVINAATGPVGNLLMMTGREYVVRKVTIASSLVVIALCVTLIPMIGANGAAIALAAGSSLQNIYMTVQVRRHLGYWPIVLLN